MAAGSPPSQTAAITMLSASTVPLEEKFREGFKGGGPAFEQFKCRKGLVGQLPCDLP